MNAVERVRGADADWSSFVGFVAKYGREYNSIREVNAKFDIFKANVIVAAQNQKRNPLARFGVTKFSDMSQEEFRSTMLMSKEDSERFMNARKHLRATKPVRPHHHHRPSNVSNDVDWCAKGLCTPIKDQGQCGSCWAFSATETLESAWQQAGNQQVELSPQQIVDCDKSDNGCNGGMPASAISYVQDAGGQMTEASYPYQGTDSGPCNFDAGSVAAKTTGSTPVGQGDDSLLKAIDSSCVSVGVDASQWSSYTGGVMTDCGTQLDHAVVATGYVSGSPGYYIVRNSWNTNWGENGFIFIASNGDVCGIADNAITVQV